VTSRDCPFCEPDPERVFYRGSRVLGLWDAFPVSEGHALLVPQRHIPTWFDTSREEQVELTQSLTVAREAILARHSPDGFNIGINIGEAGGQTVSHLHVHLIPRYRGDVEDPRGGVRHVLPSRANYLLPKDPGPDRVSDRPLEASFSGLVTGEDDPLLPHLLRHLDDSESADLLASFILESGVQLLEGHLADLLERGGRIRILTGDYLGITDPNALLRLLDLKEGTARELDVRIFVSGGTSFHPKAYLFYGRNPIAYVGSSNLSQSALAEGIEWNYRILFHSGFDAVARGFERLFHDPRTRPLDASWIESYRNRRPKTLVPPVDFSPEPPREVPEPHEIQTEALEALARTRAEGNAAGLVVLATGLGKTWLSAFDTVRFGAKRVLFVAHREEILRQALATFRAIRPEATLGLYTGFDKALEAEVLFASIQTLGRSEHLRRFGPRAFDYIIVDEFHHASARTYRRLIDHFEPEFLLGLTATPERTDGGDLLALCGENLVYRCDLVRGIERELLSPFRYIGVPDDVDYENIPWRSTRFDEEALTKAVATQKRAENALGQHRKHGGARTLAFCCSQKHADFMKEYFERKGVRAASVHTGENADPRARSLERLESGEIDVLFAVDIFNEGLDLPNIDTVMMLRPTESRILWMQQFGRGLRRAEGKERLTVVDYIGNHRTFLLKPQTLLGLEKGDKELALALERLQAGELELPPGCEVTYELEAVNILKALLRIPKEPEALKAWYESFRERHGERPTALEAHHAGYVPRSVGKTHGSWLGFVTSMGDVHTIFEGTPAGAFLKSLETTPMTKSYKMLTLLAMLNVDQFPGAILIDELANDFSRLARRNATLRADVGDALEDAESLRRLLEKNPIDAWAGGKGTGDQSFFRYDGREFRATFDVAPSEREPFQELVRELADWRLGEYLDRHQHAPTEGIVCKVSHANERPILFLPDRATHPGIPEGWTEVQIDGEHYEANFVKVAVNVMRRPGKDRNELPTLLRGWFGPDAGLPGTNFQVVFRHTDEGWTLEPANRRTREGLELWESYSREQIPILFGARSSPQWQQSGFIWEGNKMVLLVTLEKASHPEEHRYEDRFLSPDTFQWQSQNRTTQRGKPGQAIRNHREKGIQVFSARED
jgi:superfamily II DNA or RNA helicase/diadenosine tetraphosphate (Ap4A) HIT family hydrolase